MFHGDAAELAEGLHGRLGTGLAAADLTVSEMTAAMADHVGSGVVGVGLYMEPPGG